MQKLRTHTLVCLALLSVAGCWRDADRLGLTYENAWLAAHPGDATSTDTAGDDTAVADAPDVAVPIDAVDGGDSVDDAFDVADTQDAVDLCSSVTCEAVDPCQPSTCNPATGKCDAKALADTTPCNDANACTSGDVCTSGICGGKTVTCDDVNPCTDDTCAAATGCVHSANATSCSDGNACTVGDACVGGACASEPIVCDDGNVCTNNNCDALSGCVFPPNTATCTDGDACSDVDICANTVCGGVQVNCDDANACTADSCDKVDGCLHAALSGPCDDGNPCTLPDMCNGGACSGGPFAFGMHTVDSGTFDQAWGIASDSAQTWVVGSTGIDASAQRDFSVWSIGEDGGIAGQVSLGDSQTSEVGRIGVPATGGLWVIGDATTGGGGPWPSFAWFGNDLSSGTFSFAQTAVTWQVTAQQTIGAKWLLGGTRQMAGEPQRAWLGVAEVTPGSAPTVIVSSEWQSTMMQDTRLDAVVAQTDGTFLGIGTAVNAAGGDDLWLVNIAATGSAGIERTRHPGAGQLRVKSALATTTGGAVVLALADDATPAQLRLIAIDKNFAIAWRTPVGSDLWNDATLLAGTDGMYVVGTRADVLDRGAVVHLNAQGQVQWTFVTPVTALPQRLTSAHVQPDGRIVAYGWQGEKDTDLLEWGLDAFGSATCSPIGKCPSINSPITDDKNQCTLDKCDPVAGVVHTFVADASWCDDGLECTVGDACAGGKCQGGPRLFNTTFTNRTVYHMQAVTEGGFVLCGSTNDATGSSFLTWVDAAGKQKLDKLSLGTASMPGRGCAQAADDAIWQAGWSGTGNLEGARMRKVSLPTGAFVFDKFYAGLQFSAVVAHPQGGVVALGSNQPQPRVTRILANGDKGWDWLAAGVGDADNANAGVFQADGSFLVVGEKHATGAAPAAFAARLDATGTPLWTQSFAGVTGRLLGVAKESDGTVIAVGAQGQGATASAWIVRIDVATGNVQNTFSPPSPQGTVWHDLAFFPIATLGPPTGAAFLVGGTATQAVYARVSSENFAGKPETLSNVNQGSAPAYRSVVLDPSGDVVVAGTTTQAQLVRLDAWYHQTCIAAGKCIGVTPVGCDDGNVCTLEDCDGTLGCKYTNAPPNQPCQGGTCQNGQCK